MSATSRNNWIDAWGQKNVDLSGGSLKPYQDAVDEEEQRLKDFETNYTAWDALVREIRNEGGSKPTPDQKAKLKEFGALIGTHEYDSLGGSYDATIEATEDIIDSETSDQQIRQGVITPELGEQVYSKIMETYTPIKI